jgi:hypothetical protein
VTGELVVAGVAFLTYQENFIEKFSAALGFLSGIIAFCGLLFHDSGQLLMCFGMTSMHFTHLEPMNQ